MTKKHFIALANLIIGAQSTAHAFTPKQIEYLAEWCKQQSPNFDPNRWLGYIAGENGPSGGSIKK